MKLIKYSINQCGYILFILDKLLDNDKFVSAVASDKVCVTQDSLYCLSNML